MTNEEGAAWAGTEYAEAAAEVRKQLTAHLKGRPLPPDLVITTRAEIEKREFTAYGKGWRDRGEHDERRWTEPTAPDRPTSPDGAKVLPVPHTPGSPAARPHPHDELS
ncbi:hypothetical protein ACFRI7_04260 [Streptomyces sp. NPDC056716]|uniref:hypothetical protein n=1 Tax=unclassified Streptomyces TaxID=2593676 RepID=UPI0036B334E2